MTQTKTLIPLPSLLLESLAFREASECGLQPFLEKCRPLCVYMYKMNIYEYTHTCIYKQIRIPDTKFRNPIHPDLNPKWLAESYNVL